MARRPCQPLDWKARWFHELFDPSYCSPAPLSEVDKDLDSILQRCTGGLPWTTVPVGADSIEVSKYHQSSEGPSMLFNLSKFIYNDTYARNHTPPIQLPLPREFSLVYLDGWGARGAYYMIQTSFQDKIRSGDSIVINLGPHYHRSSKWAEWRSLINDLGVNLKKVIAETGAQVVWRTSYLAKEHVFRSSTHANGYVPSTHFQTDHRRLLFDSYAEDVLEFTYGESALWGVCYKPHD